MSGQRHVVDSGAVGRRFPRNRYSITKTDGGFHIPPAAQALAAVDFRNRIFPTSPTWGPDFPQRRSTPPYRRPTELLLATISVPTTHSGRPRKTRTSTLELESAQGIRAILLRKLPPFQRFGKRPCGNSANSIPPSLYFVPTPPRFRLSPEVFRIAKTAW